MHVSPNTHIHELKGNTFGSEVESYVLARKPYPQELIDFVLGIIGGDTTCIDLGSGPGRSAHRLADKVKNLVAFDWDEAMLREAKKNSNHSNITYVQGDVKDLPPNSYDHATAFEAFSWFAGHVQTIFNSLRPGGAFVVVDASGGGFQRKCREYLSQRLGKEIKRPSVADEEETLRNSGFTITRITEFKTTDVFNWKETKAKIKSHSFWSGLSECDQIAVWKDLKAFVKTMMTNNTLTLEQTHKCIVATKR